MRRDRLLKFAALETFIVNTKDGTAFRGLLEGTDANTLVLVDVEVLTTGSTTKVDGRVYIPRANVAYLQRP